MTRPVALVTGASRGIGKQLAEDLAGVGYDVAVTARSTAESPSKMPGTIDDTAERCRERGARALAVAANVRSPEEVQACVDRVYAEFGRIDLLVNNAGLAPFGSALEIPIKLFNLVMDVNVLGPLYFMRAAVPRMVAAGSGQVVNISSIAAARGAADRVAYGASKRALESIGESLAQEIEGSGVAVNALRVEMAVWSEGFQFNLPDQDLSDFEDPAVVTDALLWMVRQQPAPSGETISILDLRERGFVRPRTRVGDRWGT